MRIELRHASPFVGQVFRRWSSHAWSITAAAASCPRPCGCRLAAEPRLHACACSAVTVVKRSSYISTGTPATVPLELLRLLGGTAAGAAGPVGVPSKRQRQPDDHHDIALLDLHQSPDLDMVMASALRPVHRSERRRNRAGHIGTAMPIRFEPRSTPSARTPGTPFSRHSWQWPRPAICNAFECRTESLAAGCGDIALTAATATDRSAPHL